MFLATPWWVNLLLFVPAGTYMFYRSRGLSLDKKALAAGFAFGMAFGFVEAAVVVYLRAASGISPGSPGISAAIAIPAGALPSTSQVLASMPESLVRIEEVREAATIVMLASVALLGARTVVGWLALFLWTFATWDIAYYAGLWFTIRWPSSLREFDVLFLIPEPWISQVWFPLAVSALTLFAVMAGRKPSRS